MIKAKTTNVLASMSNRLCCFTFSIFFTVILELRVLQEDVEAF
jgi:hypothetical protein